MRAARLSDTELPQLPGLLPPWPGALVRTRSGDLFLRRTPAATGAVTEPALYVHGLGGASTNWTDLAGLLAPRLAGSAVDLPGFGHSPGAPDRNYSIPAHVRAVAAVLEATGEGPVHLFGNSLGGLVSLVLAATRPDLVRTLTLISPAMPVRFPGRTGDALLPLMLIPGVDRLAERRMAGMGPQARAQGVIDLCFADPSRVPAQRLTEAAEEVTRRAELPWAREAFTRSLRGLVGSYFVPGGRSIGSLSARIAVPTLVIWGRADRLVDVRLAEPTARAIADSRLLVLDGVGHTAQLEAPDTVARAVLALLDDARADEPSG